MKKILILTLLALLTPIARAQEETKFQWKGVSIGFILITIIFIIISYFVIKKVVYFIMGLSGIIALFLIGGVISYCLSGGSFSDFISLDGWSVTLNLKVPADGWSQFLSKAGLGGLINWAEGFSLGKVAELFRSIWNYIFGGGS